jgi:hypothetical protein
VNDDAIDDGPAELGPELGPEDEDEGSRVLLLLLLVVVVVSVLCVEIEELADIFECEEENDRSPTLGSEAKLLSAVWTALLALLARPVMSDLERSISESRASVIGSGGGGSGFEDVFAIGGAEAEVIIFEWCDWCDWCVVLRWWGRFLGASEASSSVPLSLVIGLR